MMAITDIEWMKILSIILALLAAFYPGWGARGTSRAMALSRKRQLDKLERRRDHLKRLKESDRENYGWLLSGILWVLCILAGVIGFDALWHPQPAMSPQDRAFVELGQFVIQYWGGMLALFVAATI